MTTPPAPDSPDRPLVQALARATGMLVDDFDTLESLHDLATDTAPLLEVSVAAIMLASPSRALFLVACSDEHADTLGLLRLEIYQHGPCVQCLNTGHVTSATLRTPAAGWPSFSTAALALGFRAAHAIPMRLNTQTMGVLTLLDTQARPLTTRDLALAGLQADLAVISLYQQHCLTQHGYLTEQLHIALNNRITLHQAQGILAEKGNLPIQDTLTVLRAYACTHHLRLTELAGRITADPHHAHDVLASNPSDPCQA